MSQFTGEYASPNAMHCWAQEVMDSRKPDFTIEDGDKRPYMHRWFLIPRTPHCGAMIHLIVRSDKDVPHDHPWDYTSLILDGSYREERLMRDHWIVSETFGPGSILRRKATDVHRLVIADGQPVTTLFTVGPKRREWGFHCPGGWVGWREFTNGEDHGRVGRGCGDLA